MRVKYLLLLPALVVFSGCASKNSSQGDLGFNEKPPTQIPKQYPQIKKSKGSLYSMQGASLFADKKDLQIGDIIQVIITEEFETSSLNNRELTSNNSSSFGGGVATPSAGGSASSIANSFNKSFGLSLETGKDYKTKGEAKSKNKETFETTVSAIINEVYQNGNYLIKGSKQILIEGQKQEIILTGIIRPYDISAENSIDSTQIANLKLLYNKDGEEADVMETPWGTKLLRKIWPF